MPTILSRIKTIAEKEGITIAAMERCIGASKGVLSRAISQGTDIQSKWIQLIVENYPQYSPSWLLTGKGNVFVQDKVENETAANAVVYEHSANKGLPYYDVDIAAGFDDFIDNPSSVPTYYIDFKPYNHASFWCNVTGRSMEPTIHHGDIIALKECRFEEVLYGEIYAVITDDVRTVKILRKAKSPDRVKLIPINTEEFDEQEFPIKSIRALYKVVGNMRPCF